MLINTGIEKVRAIEIPAGIWPSGGYLACNRIALVKWRSSWTNKFFQIYVNSQFAGSTLSTDQKQLVVPLPASFETAVRIEIFAVEDSHAHINFSNQLWTSGQGRVKLRLLRSQSLPSGSTVNIYFDNATGNIDYETPLNAEPIPVWPSRCDKAGFGTGRFGDGDFGYDFSPAVGLGIGDFGLGMFGADADSIEWTSDQLPKGTYIFAAIVTDAQGNISNSIETEAITVLPDPVPAENFEIETYNDSTNQLTLKLS